MAAHGSNSAVTRSVITRPAVSTNTPFDFSQNIQPDWKNAASYTRLKKNIVEIPIAPGSRFGWSIKNGTTGAITNKKYTRTSFLLFNDGKRYGAYIMMVVADSAYVGGNMGKLAHNTYRKHDADFSGMVIYFTPKGQYVGKYIYRNGQLSSSSANKAAGASTAGAAKTRAANMVRDDVNCYDVWLESFDDDGAVTEEYLGTTCSDGSGTLDASGSGGGADGGTDLGNGNMGFGDGGFPEPLGPGIFGLNNSNAIVTDGNFDALLSYVESIGLNISDPIGPGIIVDGVFYPGEVTYIVDANGNIVSSYFSPDATSSTFQLGMEYNVDLSQAGNSSSMDGVVYESIFGEMIFGNPNDYLGTGSSVSTPTTSGGNSVTTLDPSIFDTYDGNDVEPDDNNTIDNGPTGHIPSQITLNNGQIVTVIFGSTSDGLSADQPVSVRLINTLVQALNIASSKVTITTIYIKATTNGSHSSPSSNHYKGLAIDISRINGIPLIVQGSSPEVQELQTALDQSNNIRENFGPYFKHKLQQPYTVSGHQDHIHFSINGN